MGWETGEIITLICTGRCCQPGVFQHSRYFCSNTKQSNVVKEEKYLFYVRVSYIHLKEQFPVETDVCQHVSLRDLMRGSCCRTFRKTAAHRGNMNTWPVAESRFINRETRKRAVFVCGFTN